MANKAKALCAVLLALLFLSAPVRSAASRETPRIVIVRSDGEKEAARW